MKSCSRGIRKHIQTVKLLLRRILVYLIYFMVTPPGLPFLLDLSVVVRHEYYLLCQTDLAIKRKNTKKTITLLHRITCFSLLSEVFADSDSSELISDQCAHHLTDRREVIPGHIVVDALDHL